MYKQQSGRGFTKRDWWPTPGNVLFTLLAIAVYGLTQQSWAELGREGVPAVASTINYQGRLVDENGVAVTGVVDLEFEIFDSLEGGTSEWGPELHPAVVVQNGLFQVSLGSSMVITPAVWDGGERYLQVVVNGETLSPREIIHSTPTTLVAQRALTADVALTVPDGAITLNKLASNVFPSGKSHIHVSETIAVNATNQMFTSTNVSITVSRRSNIFITGKGNAITTGSGGYYVGICRNGVLIDTTHQFTPNVIGAPNHEKFGWSVIDTVNPGTYTYNICVQNSESSTSATLQWYRPVINLIALPSQ